MSTIFTKSIDHIDINIVKIISYKVVNDKEEKTINDEHFIEIGMEVKENKKEPEDVMFFNKPTEEKNKNDIKPDIALPYPQRVKKKDQNDKFFEKFLEMFIKLEINIIFFEALEQISMYQ